MVRLAIWLQLRIKAHGSDIAKEEYCLPANFNQDFEMENSQLRLRPSLVAFPSLQRTSRSWLAVLGAGEPRRNDAIAGQKSYLRR